MMSRWQSASCSMPRAKAGHTFGNLDCNKMDQDGLYSIRISSSGTICFILFITFYNALMCSVIHVDATD